MKRKCFFIIASIIQIILAIYIIINAQSVLDSTIESLKMLPENIYNVYENSLNSVGKGSIIVESIILVIINTITLIYSLCGKIEYHKGSILAFMIVNIICSNSTIALILAVISLIIICNTQGLKKEKKDIPILEYQKKNKKMIIFSILLFFYYIFLMFVLPEIITINSRVLGLFISIFTYVSLIVLSILIFYKELKDGIKNLFTNFGSYFSLVLKKYLIFLAIYLPATLIVLLIKQSELANQQELTNLPLYIAVPLALFYAPFVEECVFRGTIRNVIKNEKLFIVVSGMLFGLVHALAETSIISVILSTIPYGLLGGFLAYLYVKSNNITCNMLGHFLINLLSSLMLIISALI